MADKKPAARNSFRQLEQKLTYVVFADLALFVLMMILSMTGVIWLKVIAGLLVMAASAAGCLFLVLINELKRPRSWWMLSAFASLLLCALVSLITGSPA